MLHRGGRESSNKKQGGRRAALVGRRGGSRRSAARNNLGHDGKPVPRHPLGVRVEEVDLVRRAAVADLRKSRRSLGLSARHPAASRPGPSGGYAAASPRPGPSDYYRRRGRGVCAVGAAEDRRRAPRKGQKSAARGRRHPAAPPRRGGRKRKSAPSRNIDGLADDVLVVARLAAAAAVPADVVARHLDLHARRALGPRIDEAARERRVGQRLVGRRRPRSPAVVEVTDAREGDHALPRRQGCIVASGHSRCSALVRVSVRRFASCELGWVSRVVGDDAKHE